VNGIPLILFLLQDNYLVYHGWIPGLVTSIIVATPDLSGVEDVFFNAISIVFIDGLFRSSFSPRQYYLVFLITAIIGNVLSLVGYGPNSPPSFGASGGIFGLLAAALSTDFIVNRRLNTTLLIWFIFVFVISTIGPNIDAYAHIGGTISGLVAGILIGRERSRIRSYWRVRSVDLVPIRTRYQEEEWTSQGYYPYLGLSFGEC
jgi:rhomboid protease GluP